MPAAERTPEQKKHFRTAVAMLGAARAAALAEIKQSRTNRQGP